MAELAPGTQFGGYRIEAIAGQGGMGVVYKATQLGLERVVALKVITPAFAHDPEFRERFKRESRLAASIEHPNVIPVYEAGEQDEVLFMAMRYIEGTDVKSLLVREGRLEPLRAARFVAQIAAALDAAHSAGLVHRDVKPANALLAADDHVYLTDFGLTKRAASGSAMTKTGQMVGTVDYVAPEQVSGTAVDARTDVYSLACVLFHLVTGRVPFDKPTEMAKLFAHVHDDPPAPSEYVPGLPAEIDAVVARGMAKEPSERFLSAGDLGRAALAAAEHRSIQGPERSVARGEAAPEGVAAAATVVNPQPATAAQAPASAGGRRGPLIAGAVAGLAALVLAVVLLGGGSDDPPAGDGASSGAPAASSGAPATGSVARSGAINTMRTFADYYEDENLSGFEARFVEGFQQTDDAETCSGAEQPMGIDATFEEYSCWFEKHELPAMDVEGITYDSAKRIVSADYRVTDKGETVRSGRLALELVPAPGEDADPNIKSVAFTK